MIPSRCSGIRVSDCGQKIERFNSVGFADKNFGHSSTSIPARRIINGGIRLQLMLRMCNAFRITNRIVFPVYSQSYATAASTTGTNIGAPNWSVKPFTGTFLPVGRIIAA